MLKIRCLGIMGSILKAMSLNNLPTYEESKLYGKSLIFEEIRFLAEKGPFAQNEIPLPGYHDQDAHGNIRP